MNGDPEKRVWRNYGRVPPAMAGLARRILRLLGWRIAGTLPPDKKLVILFAPHTSTWDFPLIFLLATSLGIRGNFLAKESLGKPPRSWIAGPAGAIPVDRGHHENMVAAVADVLGSYEGFYLVIAPEGTRSRADHWKTGFYYIALETGARIACLYADAQTRTLGFGPVLTPSGDIDADFEPIRAFYAGITPRRPENWGPITLYPPEN